MEGEKERGDGAVALLCKKKKRRGGGKGKGKESGVEIRSRAARQRIASEVFPISRSDPRRAGAMGEEEGPANFP